MINAHTHLYSGLAPLGMPAPEREPTCFLDILEGVWWKLDRALDGETLAASARYYVSQAIAAGCRGLIDHHESPNFIEGSLDVIADACQELGMPALLCYGATERNGGRDEARRGLEECRRFIRDNRRPLVRGAVGVHAAFTVSDDTLAEAAALARETGTVVHIHVAEDRADVADAKKRGHSGLIDRLEACDALVPGSIFAHGVHLTRGEVERVDAAGIWLVQNPRSNRGNRVGYPAAVGASQRVALGTDGFPANMADERVVLAELAAEHGEPKAVAAARLAGSARLFEERMGPAAALAPSRHLGEANLDEAEAEQIRQDAIDCANTLWKRMKAL